MEAPEQSRWDEFKTRSWIVFSAATTIWAHLALAVGAFRSNLFDGSIFFLQILYAARGLKPYVDFGFVYPPGPAWLFGQVMQLREIKTVLPAVSLLNLLLVAGGLFLVARITKERWQLRCAAYALCIGTIMPLVCMYQGLDPCPISMLSVMVLLLLLAVRRSEIVSALTLAAFVAISTFWRWDRAIGPIALLLFGAFVLWLTSHFTTRHRRRHLWMARHLLRAGLYTSAGVATALVIMFANAVFAGALRAEWEFSFQIPFLISQYNRIPIQIPLGANMQWFSDCVSIVLIAVVIYTVGVSQRAHTSWRMLLNGFVMLSCAAGLLPYSFKRPDAQHFIPLTAVLLTSLIAAVQIWDSRKSRRKLKIAAFLILLPMTGTVIAQISKQGLAPKRGALQEEIASLTQGCSELIPKDARSLFVGKGSYREYQINWPILYLANPELRPATSFISEEPGLQNTCRFGAHVANDLAHAPRPTALILDGYPWHDKYSEVFRLSDCRKIEAELRTLPVSTLGSCSVDYRHYEVAVIR